MKKDLGIQFELSKHFTLLDRGEHLLAQWYHNIPSEILRLFNSGATPEELDAFVAAHHPTFNYSAQGRLDITLLHIAIIKGDCNMIRFLVEEKNADIQRACVQLGSPLAAACLVNNSDAFDLLLALGADPTYYTEIDLLDAKGTKCFSHIAGVTQNVLLKKTYLDGDEEFDSGKLSPLTAACFNVLNLDINKHQITFHGLKNICKKNKGELDPSRIPMLFKLIKAGSVYKQHLFFPVLKDWQERRTAVLMGIFGHELERPHESSTLEPLARLNGNDALKIILNGTKPSLTKGV